VLLRVPTKTCRIRFRRSGAEPLTARIMHVQYCDVHLASYYDDLADADGEIRKVDMTLAAGIRIFGEHTYVHLTIKFGSSSPTSACWPCRLPMGCPPAWPRYGGRPASCYLDRPWPDGRCDPCLFKGFASCHGYRCFQGSGSPGHPSCSALVSHEVFCFKFAIRLDRE
jgi:hypothetical protein